MSYLDKSPGITTDVVKAPVDAVVPDSASEGPEHEGDNVGTATVGRLQQCHDLLKWVNSHPILATVIWVFGRVVSGNQDLNSSLTKGAPGSTSTGSHSSSGGSLRKASSRRLSWNDEHGGCLAEYFDVSCRLAVFQRLVRPARMQLL
jgi:hypothetical protein